VQRGTESDELQEDGYSKGEEMDEEVRVEQEEVRGLRGEAMGWRI
jgi:hypothetical protein